MLVILAMSGGVVDWGWVSNALPALLVSWLPLLTANDFGIEPCPETGSRRVSAWLAGCC